MRDNKRKLQQRANIGYLVGYQSTNTFRIWYPKTDEVVITRDVTFNEKIFWDPNRPDPTEALVTVAPEISDVVESPVLESHDITEVSDEEEAEEAEAPQTQVLDNPQGQQCPNSNGHTQQTLQKSTNLLPTPDMTLEVDSPPTASLRIQAHFTGLSNVHDESGFHAAFSTAIHTAKKARLHRDMMPPPPKTWRDLNKHPYKAEFIKAAEREYKSLQDMHTFTEVEKPKDKQILPLLWVYTYKFDTDGYVTKFKARICVRGDLQKPSKEDNYAATLAAKTLRLLCGIIAAFDLEATQFDAVNAFLHSHLEDEIYVQYPDGFKKPGKSLRLLKALYGLRQSPKL